MEMNMEDLKFKFTFEGENLSLKEFVNSIDGEIETTKPKVLGATVYTKLCSFNPVEFLKRNDIDLLMKKATNNMNIEFDKNLKENIESAEVKIISENTILAGLEIPAAIFHIINMTTFKCIDDYCMKYKPGVAYAEKVKFTLGKATIVFGDHNGFEKYTDIYLDMPIKAEYMH